MPPQPVTDANLRRGIEAIAGELAQAQDHVRQVLDRLGGIPAGTPEPAELTEFELTRDHVTLLRHAWVTWRPAEWGGPQIDPKRPFGNGDLWLDVARILGWPSAEDSEDSHPHYDAAVALHADLLPALQVVLGAGSFEPGRYERVDYRTWRRVG